MTNTILKGRGLLRQSSLLEGNVSERLSFGTTNAKLNDLRIATFALPAGHTCPGANKCLTWVDPSTKRIVDGPEQKYRCYAASMEVAYPSLWLSVTRNLERLRQASSVDKMAELISNSLPPVWYHTIRVHSDGDFFSPNYFLAWLEAARQNPQRTFYAYTKSLPMLVKYRKLIPSNFIFTASWGGKFDTLINQHNLKSAVVLATPFEMELLGLEKDEQDLCARNAEPHHFALLVHGTQPKASEASAARAWLKANGMNPDYGKKSRK